MNIKYLENGDSISDCGKVFNPKGLERKPFANEKTGELRVRANFKNYSIKKLMAAAFLEGYDPIIHGVYFINGDVTDLRPENLTYKIKSKRIIFDKAEYERLRSLGFTNKAIAEKMGMNTRTLYHKLKETN